MRSRCTDGASVLRLGKSMKRVSGRGKHPCRLGAGGAWFALCAASCGNCSLGAVEGRSVGRGLRIKAGVCILSQGHWEPPERFKHLSIPNLQGSHPKNHLGLSMNLKYFPL